MSARDFPQLFRAFVGPKLRTQCLYHGALVMLDDEDYSVAYNEIVHLAVKLGATHLPDELLYELEDQIHTWLIEEIDKAETMWKEECLTRHSREFTPPYLQP